MAVTVVYKRLRDLLIFSLYIITVAIIFYVIIPNPQINSLLFIVALISIIFVALVSGFSKLDLDAHLEFTNEVVRNADALVFIVNRSGDNEYTSQSVHHILGYSPQELKNHDWIERIVLNKTDAIRIKNELILIAIGAIEPVTNPYQKLVRKDGEEVWLSINEKRLSANRVLVMGMVVTENKRIQDELEKSESNFRQINETLADVFYLYNIQAEKYEYLSPNSAEIIGPTPQFFYDNQNYLETYIIEEDQQRTRKAYQSILKGLPFEIEYRIRIGSELKWIRERSHPILNEEGQVIKNAGLCQDITERKNTEQEIQKLSLIASNTDNFILMVDRDNRVEWANQSFYKLTGLTEEETYGKLPLQLISGPLTSEKTIDEITKAIFEDKRQMQCELTNYKADGSLFFTTIEVTPLLNEDGDFEKYFVIGSDITQRISDQSQIEKLSLVASNTSNYIIIAHADTGIEWVNQAFIDKFGYSLEEVEGKFPLEILHDKNDQSGSAELINKTIFGDLKKFSGEITHVTKEGQIIYSNVDITPLISDDGSVEKYFVVGVDISERKKYEEKIERANLDLSIQERLLNESEQNFRELIRSLKEVFFLFDTVSGQFIFISDSFESIFGQTKQNLIDNPMSWLQNVHSDDRDRVEKAVLSRTKENIFNEDFRLFMPSGEMRWVNSRMFDIYNEKGEPIKISGFTEDITLKKQQELQIKKIADQLDIIHSIEKTILQAESTEDIIYNTLQKTIDKLPIIRASLTLFDPEEDTFFAYVRDRNQRDERTDGKEFPLSEFSLYETLKESKTNYLQNLKEKENLSYTDKLIMSQGAEILLISPLLHGDNLIGSLNVCFNNEYKDNDDHYTHVTNEVANGVAIAIQQSQLKDRLHLSNRAINSSIEYAKMIQQAYIPSTVQMDGYFKDHFIINRPKDIVSGDFYWTGESGDTKIIVVGDCTGHGVPGAFMTIIGISELSNIVTQRGIVDPAKILKELDLAIVQALASSDRIQLKDGMDVAVFAYNMVTNVICFEGARRPLYQMTAEGLEIVEAAKLSLGDVGHDFGVTFNTKPISHASGDQFFLFSDGITDQFGGERQRKFSRRRLEEFLLENKTKSVTEKGTLLNERLLEWQGNSYQTDDIMFIAFTL
jgi:PAS domain S-box-containing protein